MHILKYFKAETFHKEMPSYMKQDYFISINELVLIQFVMWVYRK